MRFLQESLVAFGLCSAVLLAGCSGASTGVEADATATNAVTITTKSPTPSPTPTRVDRNRPFIEWMERGKYYYEMSPPVEEIRQALGLCLKSEWLGIYPQNTRVAQARWGLDLNDYSCSHKYDIDEYGSAEIAKKQFAELLNEWLEKEDIAFRKGRYLVYTRSPTKKQQEAFRAASDSLGVKLYSGDYVYTPKPDSEKPRFIARDGIEYRWMKTNEFNCKFSGAACWGIMIRAVESCDRGVFVEVNILDASKSVIGGSNDLVNSLSKGKTAKLLFHTYDDNAEDVEITSVECYR